MLKNKLVFTAKREFWEYQKILFVLPLLLALLFILLPFGSVLTSDYAGERIFQLAQNVAGFGVEANFDSFYSGVLTFFAVPLIAVSFFVQLYYLISCMYDERKDLSIMFWRSMPVADGWQVAIKLLMGTLFIPLIFMLAAMAVYIIYYAAALIVSLYLSFNYDISLWHVWFDFGVVSAISDVFYLLIPFSLWMLPLFSWLLLASSYAQKAPFLWAILPIVIVVVVEAVARQYGFMSEMYLTSMITDYFNLAADFHHTAVNEKDLVSSSSTATFSMSTIPEELVENKLSISALILSGIFIYASYWFRVNRPLN